MSDDNQATETPRRPTLRDPMKASNTVTVACKLPNGLILRVFDMVETSEVVQGGYRDVKIARPRPEQFEVRGNAIPIGVPNFPVPEMADGFAITRGCPKELWDLWEEQNKHSHLVQKGLIFSSSSINALRDEIKNRRDLKSGLEPIDPEHPERFAPDTRSIRRERREEVA